MSSGGVSLRGHHLICLHFFNGEGYDESFIDNLRSILHRAKVEEITVASGADDVCVSCPYLQKGICRHEDGADEAIREMDAKAIELLGLGVGERVTWDVLAGSVGELLPIWYALNCVDCDWKGSCEKNLLFRQLSKSL